MTHAAHPKPCRSSATQRLRNACMLLAAIAVAACGRESEPRDELGEIVASSPRTGVRVAIVAIDGASPTVLRDVIAAGEAPAFAGLIDEGASGVLRSQRPMKSPAIWTTIATGVPRDEHGIVDFERPAIDGRRDRRLVTSNDRRRLALWNIASAFGRTNGWAGYWVTWPAEPVEGWMLSDRMARTRYTEWIDGTRTEGATHPPELYAALAPRLVDPAEPPMQEIDQLVQLTPQEREELLRIDQPLFGHALSVLRFAYCTQRSYERMTLAQLDRSGPPDLLGVFLVACDPISHTFWHWYRPESFPAGVDRDDAKRLGAIVPAIYRHNDAFLGELRRRLDPDTVLFVISDHGFEATRILPKRVPPASLPYDLDNVDDLAPVAVGQSGKHHVEGLFLAAGGPIVEAAHVRAELVDIAPTVLALLGIPIPEDLPGRVLEEILDPDFLERHPVRRVGSYERLIERPVLPEAAKTGEERLQDQLEALGYIRPR